MTTADTMPPADARARLDDYFVVLAPDDIRLAGSRVGIESILAHYVYHARTAEEIAALFPSLTLEQVYATILLYPRDRARIGAYLSAWLEWSANERRHAARDPRGSALETRLQEARRQSEPEPASVPGEAGRETVDRLLMAREFEAVVGELYAAGGIEDVFRQMPEARRTAFDRP
jgi:hypothetical protein